MNESDIKKLINWSEVSRLLTGDRTQIRANYSGKKYKAKISHLLKSVEQWAKSTGGN